MRPGRSRVSDAVSRTFGGAFVLTLLWSAPSFAGHWEVSPGPYNNDPRLRALLTVLEDARAHAIDVLKRQWGIRPGARQIVWRVDASHTLLSDGAGGAELGRTDFEVRDGAPVVVVTLPARRFLSAPRLARSVVVHEAAHAFLASRMSIPSYLALPSWFREGLAVLAANEGERRLRERIARTVLDRRAPAAFLRGLNSSIDVVTDTEGYLALKEFDRRLGRAALRFAIGRIAGGVSVESALAEAASIAWPELRAELARQVKAAVEGHLTDARAQRFRLLSHGWPQLRGDSVRALEMFQTERPKGPLGDTVRYMVARALWESEPDRSRGQLEELLSGDGWQWRAAAGELLARSLVTAGERHAAERGFRDVIEMFGEQSPAGRRAARALAGLGERPAAGDR